MTVQPLPGFHLLHHPLAALKVTALRDKNTPSPEFRRVLQQLAQIVAYEALRDLEVKPVTVQTPLALVEGMMAARPVVLVPILRAGLAMADGILQMLPSASVRHVGMFRHEETLQPESYYFRLPPHAPEANVLLLDPMLATGNSISAAAERLQQEGVTRITCVCILAARPGIESLRKNHPGMPIYSAALDEKLDQNGYITPGLGDAGDRLFGT